MSYIQVEVTRLQRTRFFVKLPDSVDLTKYLGSLNDTQFFTEEKEQVLDALKKIEAQYIEEIGARLYLKEFWIDEEFEILQQNTHEIPKDDVEPTLCCDIKKKK